MIRFYYNELKKNNIIGGDLHRTYHLFFLLFAIIFLISCTQKTAVQSEKRCLDSLICANHNVDSLKSYIKHYQKEDNKNYLITAYRALGTVYSEQNQFKKAVETHLNGLRISLELSDTLEIVQSLNNIAAIYLYLNQYPQASSYYYESFPYSKNFSRLNEKPMLQHRVKSLNGIGDVFMRQENWKMADSAYCLALNCEKQLDNILGQANCYANLGRMFESMNEIDSAKVYFRKSMMYHVEAHSEIGQAFCHLHFGNLYEKEGHLDIAIREYLLTELLSTKNNDEKLKLESTIAIAKIYFLQKDQAKFRLYLEKAKSLAAQIGSKRHLSAIHQLYYAWYKAEGDYKQALDNYLLSENYKDSVMDLVKLNRIYDTRFEFLEDAHQTELQSMLSDYEKEKNLNKQLVILFVMLTIVVVLVIVNLTYLLHTKRKTSAEIKKMERMRSNFFINMTHEFRTPLTVILGLAKQLKEDPSVTKDDLEKKSAIISYQGNQLLELVNQLLDIAKIQSSLGVPHWCRGNVIAYIDMLVENFQEVAHEKHIELVFLSQEKTVEMDYASDYMNKIIQNLLANALKFTQEYGKIYITASVKKEHLIVYVADNGKGISDEDLPHIFDPFFQAGDGLHTEGTGVGLSLVHQLVLAMKGTIDVKSSVKEGTVFILKFPLKRNLSNVDESDALPSDIYDSRQDISIENSDLPVGKDADESVPMVLIIEDNIDMSYFIGSQLREKYTLRYARNGKMAMEIAEDLLPDLIISDVIMPEMDGYEVCHTVRNSQQLCHIPIILISVLNSEEERLKGLEAGADVYLCKPFNSNELNDRVEYLLKERKVLRHKFTHVQNESDHIETSEANQQFLNKLTDITYSIMSSGNVTVEEVASRMLMSRQQMNRKIHAITGENAVSYLMRIRLNKAKMMLDSPKEYLIGEVAVECGFDDVAYFSRIFKKTYNITPTQYRRRVKD